MNTSIVSREDMNYLAQQSAGKLNMVLSGMTALLNDNENKVNMLESQTWFQRMSRTLTGKNKMTQQEIQRNHDKINLYMSQAMTALYEQNCIDHQVMMSLGNQINELYAEHLQLKQMLGAFVNKLNEKIESIDNFHILVTEIEQGIYSGESAIISICKIVSQLDKRTALDNRKMDILYRGLQQQGILSDTEKLLGDYLLDFTDIGIESIGAIYLELETIRDNYMAELLLKLIESYHFLPDMARKLKNRQSVVEEIIKNEKLDSDIKMSVAEVYQNFVESKVDMLDKQLPIEEIQNSMMLETAEKQFLDCKYGEALEAFECLAEQGNGRAMYFLGLYYEYGYEMKYIDKEKAKRLYHEGEKCGDVLSAYMSIKTGEDKEEKAQRYKELGDEILDLAQSGNIFAQRMAAEMFENGYGVSIDNDVALDFYIKSANGGCSEAMNDLGLSYVYGKKCVEKDKEEAAKWYKKAASRGDARGWANWGLCNKLGIGVEEDKYEAVKWYRKAAEQGNASGQSKLGRLYEYGEGGLAKDEYEAVKWYRKAAGQGDDEGQYNLGRCYQYGIGGVIEDNVEAVKWYRKAAEQGQQSAIEKLAETFGIYY